MRRRAEREDDVDGFVGAAARSLLGGVRDLVEDGAQRAVRWTAGRLLLCALAMIVWAAAVVLVVIAGVEGMKALQVPTPVSCGLFGIVAALGGWACWSAAVRESGRGG
jgi:hypothetical protein